MIRKNVIELGSIPAFGKIKVAFFLKADKLRGDFSPLRKYLMRVECRQIRFVMEQ